MSDHWVLKVRFGEGGVHELSVLPPASRRKQPREDADGGSSSSSYGKRNSVGLAVTLAAFASVIAILFLVSHCAALSREALPKRLGRRLAGQQGTKDGESADFVQEVCGGEGSQLGTATRRRGRSPEPVEAGLLELWDEPGEEPPRKKKQEALEVQPETSFSPSRAAGTSAESGEGGAAEKLRQSILRYVEQTLEEKDDGVEPEDWLLEPYLEVQFLDEETSSQSLSSSESAAAGSPAEPGTSERTAAAPPWPEGGTSGSPPPGEESPCTHVFSGCRRRTVCESNATLGIKELLKKPMLDSVDLDRLMEHLEVLVENAILRVPDNLDGLKPKYVVEKLAFAVLLTDAIYAASEVLGPAARRSEWWQQVIDTLPVYTERVAAECVATGLLPLPWTQAPVSLDPGHPLTGEELSCYLETF
ncbi:LOW QUALITY PROTEIN: uncharacterized protein EMH_0075120 [Eimeria mitis]|uniref:Uncharacterized protein n=1 Tax=Eimeria mitis TaxID=44415 RepID=U6KJ83_9EIME|nr:LOW QUALITY PROTEIN: uncharacterized protein EMH_0075120 [Eimeria mitis]CDJ35518.1 hypothetical protein, conserved [Eimeria mitis]